MRFIGATTLALACAFGLAAQAQETTTKTETKVKADEAKTVTFSGCVKPGSDAKAFILEKAVPIRKTTTEEATGTSGVVTTTTSTTYALVPGESVELTGDVGHKVEVTGTVDDGKMGKDKMMSKDKMDKDKMAMSDMHTALHVTSVKMIAATCP